MILTLKYEQDPKLLEKMGSKVSAQIIKMELKTAEYHDKFHPDLSSSFYTMKMSFFSLGMWCVDWSSTWGCSKQLSPDHYQCKHLARKTASYVKQIAAPIADLLLTLLYYLTMWFRGGCIRSNTFTGHLINGVMNSW